MHQQQRPPLLTRRGGKELFGIVLYEGKVEPTMEVYLLLARDSEDALHQALERNATRTQRETRWLGHAS